MKYKIVHIEDNLGDAYLLKDAMETYHCNYAIHSIKDGHEAFDILFEGKGIETDLFILDLNLPKVDGITILKKLKKTEKYKDIPVIILTSSGNLRDVEICRETGANFYYVKPFELNEYETLVSIICSYL